MRYRLDDWPRMIIAFESGEVDVDPMFWSTERAEQFQFSVPFFSLQHANLCPHF